jgi:hypothetical protein
MKMSIRLAGLRNGPTSVSLFSKIVALSIAVTLLAGCGKKPDGNAAAASDNGYQPGTMVRFGVSGDAKRYQVSGWSTPEAEFTWTDQKSAVLTFRLNPERSSYVLKMTLQGLVKPPDLPSQTVEVKANQQPVATWEVSAKREFSATIPPDSLKADGLLTIILTLPKATTPVSLGMNTDQRLLGVSCYDLQLIKQ